MGENSHGFCHGSSQDHGEVWFYLSYGWQVNKVHFIPIRIDYKAQQLTKIYAKEMVSLHGLRFSIISDYGIQFTSNFLKRDKFTERCYRNKPKHIITERDQTLIGNWFVSPCPSLMLPHLLVAKQCRELYDNPKGG